MADLRFVQPEADMDGFPYQALSYVQVSDSFYGTTYSASGAGWVRPDTIYVRPGINGIVNNQTMDTNAAAASSEDPRLLAGYPKARNIAPTAATIS